MILLILVCILSALGCEPGAWNPPVVGYRDEITGCPKYMHTTRGPDAYDRAHGQPYHCETPQYDPDNSDIDPVAQ